jgi:hypothetical protein
MKTWEEKQILFYNSILLVAGIIVVQIQKVAGSCLIGLALVNMSAVFLKNTTSSTAVSKTLSPRKLKDRKKIETREIVKKKSNVSPKRKKELKNLDSLLKQVNTRQERKSIATTDNLQKFLPASQLKVQVKVERIEDGFLFKNTSATMEEFYDVAPLLDDWCEGIRKWMEQVVSPLSKRIQAVDEAFERAGLSYLDCKSMTLDSRTDPLISENGQIFLKKETGKPRSLLELYQAYSNVF